MLYFKLSFLIFLLCILISFKDRNAHHNELKLASHADAVSVDGNRNDDVFSLTYDFYRDTCPRAESTIRAMTRWIYKHRKDVAPSLLRLLFHDCFVEGCDASVLLDAVEGMDSEKDSPPNETLKGFDVIDKIKEKLEQRCPGVVSCADILVLATRDAVVLAGGPFYPLLTGRRDSMFSYSESASAELPSPQADLSETLASFASRGFDTRETVSLFGAHSIGVIHCKFFMDRLYNFDRTNHPDPSLDHDFLNIMRSTCSNVSSTFSIPSTSAATSTLAVSSHNHTGSRLSATSYFNPYEAGSSKLSAAEQEVKVAYGGPETAFGTSYYRSLLENKGILYTDQQLMTAGESEIWVRAYASDVNLFHRDFALSMMKLSNLRTLTAPMGQIRFTCSKIRMNDNKIW